MKSLIFNNSLLLFIMSDSFMLSLFSLAMFIGSYLSGLIPLAFNLSEVRNIFSLFPIKLSLLE